MPEIMDGETEDEYVKRCMDEDKSMVEEDLRTNYQSKMGKKSYDDGCEAMYTSAVSFAEYDAEVQANAAARAIRDDTKVFQQLVDNIMWSMEITDKAAAIQALANEFAGRVGSDASEVEEEDVPEELEDDMKAVTFDDSEWNGAASNWETAEAYCKDCLLDFNTGSEKTKEMCKLPYRKDGGAPNKNALKAIASGARGLSAVTKPADVSQEEFDRQVKSAATKLIGWWPDAFDTDAPESIYAAAGKEKPAEKKLAQLWAWIEDIKAFFGGQKTLSVNQSGFKFTKDANGDPWIVLWSTNSFEDREKEIFSTQSIDDFIDRYEQSDAKGDVWFFHLPGSKFATIKMQARVGRFLVEGAKFDNTEMGKFFAGFFEQHPVSHPVLAPNGWGQSHGYRFMRKDRVDGVYHAFDKYESTILAWDIAANQHNPRPQFLSGGKIMNDKQREAFESVFGKELTAQMISQGETKTAELEEAGVAFKAVEEPVQEEVVEEIVEETPEEDVKEEVVEKPVEEVVEEPVEEEVKEESTPDYVARKEIEDGLQTLADALTEKFEKMVEERVSAAIDEIIEVVVPMAKQLKELTDSDEQKIASRVQDTPTASLSAIISSSIIGTKEAQVDGRSSLAKDGPEEAETKSAGPSIAGTKLTLWK